MNRSSIYLYSGLGALIYSLYAGFKYYAITGKGLISGSKAKKMIQNGEIKNIIDVRTEIEFNMGHYKGAKNIPVTSINEEISLNKKKGILVYCNTGQRARRAAEKLRELGYEKVYYIEGTYHSLR